MRNSIRIDEITSEGPMRSLAERLNDIEPGAGMHAAETLDIIQLGTDAALLILGIIILSHVVMSVFAYKREKGRY